jgi:hypothetical protein
MVTRNEIAGVGLFAVTAIWSLALALFGLTDALLYMAPALLVALPLALGRFLGEERLAALRARERVRPRLRPAGAISGDPRPPALVPRGGLLIASSLAKRPPPLPSLAQ